MSSMSISSSIQTRIRPVSNSTRSPSSSFQNPSFLFFNNPFTSSKSSSSSISFQNLPTKPNRNRILSSPSPLQPIEELPQKLQQLMFYGTSLPNFDEKYKTKENKVEGCASRVWVRAYLDDNCKDVVYFEADSDSGFTKGLAALLVLGLSGQPVSEIVRVKPDFVTLLGLKQPMSPSRNNGFLNMLSLMKAQAVLVLLQKGEDCSGFGSSGVDSGGIDKGFGDLNENVVISSSVESDGDDNGGLEKGSDDWNENVVISSVNEENSSSGDDNGGRKERIREVLERELKPVVVVLEIEDVSYQHAGHGGVEGHYNLKVVSNEFEGKSLVKRHRIIYG